MFNFEKMELINVIEEAKNGNDFAYKYIIKKYEGMIHGIIRSNGFYLPGGGDDDDLVQEGFTGLYKAIRDYNPANGSFEHFCKLVVRRHIITAVKKSTRLKNKPLNEMYSIDKSLPDNENLTMMDIIGFKDEVINRSSLDHVDPEVLFILNETIENQKNALEGSLSNTEKEVYELHVEGLTYKEIMERLNISNSKVVDNTIQRINRKFKVVQMFDEDYEEDIDVNKQKIN